MVTIANSLVGAYGANLGLTGDYCESFAHWLAGASALSHNVFCDSETCGDAVQYYTENEIYDVRTDPSGFAMQPGDIAYYDVQNYGTDQVTAGHTGFVVGISGNNYIAVEGNAGETAPNGQQRVAVVIGDRSTGTNTTHGRILHGVGRPFGRG